LGNGGAHADPGVLALQEVERVNLTAQDSPDPSFPGFPWQWEDGRTFFDAPPVLSAELVKPATFPALRRSYRRADGAAEIEALARRDLDRDPVVLLDREDAFQPLERATRTFRYMRLRAYRSKAAAARELLRKTNDVFARLVSMGAEDVDAPAWQARKLEGRVRWYEGRAAAQLPRFDRVRECGKQSIRVNCRVCATDLCVLPCRCGVVRVCDACASTVAERRQKRIAAARLGVLLDADAGELLSPRRWGGAFSEKMLTLTVPHVSWAECSGKVTAAESSPGLVWGSTVSARMTALRLAWPKFLRSMRRWLGGLGRKRDRRSGDPLDARRIAYYRFFEWTRGGDGLGHPHFHVYLFSPFVDVRLCRRWWAQALESVGCPVPRRCGRCDDTEACPFADDRGRHVVLDIRRLEGFNLQALKELAKSGDRKAIEGKLGELRAPGLDAVKYSDAWTMSDAFRDLPPEARESTIHVQRDLYIAGEGRRFAQGARGFLEPRELPICRCCGASIFAARLLTFADDCPSTNGADLPREERGPP
jgi:hypothetical protein